MIRRIFSIFFILFLLFITSYAEQLRVCWVKDGDTIVLTNGKIVRYLGINAPELGSIKWPEEPYAREALAYNIKLVKGKVVYLETDIEKYDRYGRLLAYVFLKDGTFVNLEMVKAGYAYVLFLKPNLKYRKELLAAQRAAMKKRKNIWQVLLKETCTYYLGNKRSFKFHRPNCELSKMISRKNRIIFKNKWDAFYRGYSPCRWCMP